MENSSMHKKQDFKLIVPKSIITWIWLKFKIIISSICTYLGMYFPTQQNMIFLIDDVFYMPM